MNITTTFRHVEGSEALRAYAQEKVSRLQKYLRQPMRARVTLALDKLKHSAEVQISSGSEHLEAHEESDDMYASIDRVVDKLERQIGSHKGVSQDRKRRGDTLRSSPDNGARSAADQEAAAALEAKAGE